MPRSRQRKQRRPAPRRPVPGVDAARAEKLTAMRPWIEAMIAVNDAERAGEAARALSLIGSRPFDQDGRLFWRTSRIERLGQLIMLGPDLPPWIVSRWIVAQTHDDLGAPGDRRRRRAEQIAVDVRGGLAGLSTHGDDDARCKVADHDWVYRQVYTYELGGLGRFVRTCATPALVARADHIHDWAGALMCGLLLLERRPRTLVWQRLDTGERLELHNIGSAALVAVGEHVLGRLVPVEGGLMLEGAPLAVPRSVAERVAADPSSWIHEISRSRDDIETGGFEVGVPHDVPGFLWQCALLDAAAPLPDHCDMEYVAGRALALARECLDPAWVPDPDEIDLWACVRAALLSPSIVERLPRVAGPDDLPVLTTLAGELVAPADAVCREVLEELRSAA
jgi:hypothetical protein